MTGFLYAGLLCYAGGLAWSVLALRSGNRDRLTRAGTAALGGALFHTIYLIAMGAEKGHFPVTNSFEAFLFLATAVMYLGLGLDWIRKHTIFLVATLPLALITALLAVILHLTAPPRAEPATGVSSIWISIHVVVTLLSYGAFALAFVTGVLYLLAQRQLKERSFSSLLGFMPSLEAVARINFWSIAIGVPLLLAGLLLGYLPAHLNPAAYDLAGRSWRSDPKIWLTTITLAAYFAVLVLNARPAFKGRRAALASIASFVLVMATFWANIFWSDFHRFR